MVPGCPPNVENRQVGPTWSWKRIYQRCNHNRLVAENQVIDNPITTFFKQTLTDFVRTATNNWRRWHFSYLKGRHWRPECHRDRNTAGRVFQPPDCTCRCWLSYETTTVFEGEGQSRGIHSNRGNSEIWYLTRISFKHSVIVRIS